MPDRPTPAPTPATVAAAERAYRDEAGRVLAALIPHCGGDFAMAEESVHDAVVIALERWPLDGTPRNPAAWLLQVARRRALDRLRRERSRADREAAALRLEHQLRDDDGAVDDIGDDRLRLLFTCCHPALALDTRVALTLRAVGGLSTGEIARAFLVPEATLAQRLVRARTKIRAAAIPYRIPSATEMPERLDGVLAVVYLIFNEGYSASSGDHLVRPALCAEAIRLARIVVDLTGGEPEAVGLLALLLLHDSRRAARTDADGAPILLEAQDRSRWDRVALGEGLALLAGALAAHRPGPYQIQAAISAVHAEAATAHATDWAQIAALYAELMRHAPSPVVTLNRAVAVAMVDGPEAGLTHVEDAAAAGTLEAYLPLWATRADLLRRAGRHREAAMAYRRAIELSRNGPERAHLEDRLGEVEGPLA